jgi:hypothetical protein
MTYNKLIASMLFVVIGTVVCIIRYQAKGPAATKQSGSESIYNGKINQIATEGNKKHRRLVDPKVVVALRRNVEMRREHEIEYYSIPRDTEYWNERLPRYLEGIISDGVPNVRWQKEVFAEGTEVLQKWGLKETNITSVECAGAVCRAVVTHGTEKEYTDFGGLSALSCPWQKNVVTNGIENEDGTWSSIVYFSDGSDMDISEVR